MVSKITSSSDRRRLCVELMLGGWGLPGKVRPQTLVAKTGRLVKRVPSVAQARGRRGCQALPSTHQVAA